jgi:hypothetical protein
MGFVQTQHEVIPNSIVYLFFVWGHDNVKLQLIKISIFQQFIASNGEMFQTSDLIYSACVCVCFYAFYGTLLLPVKSRYISFRFTFQVIVVLLTVSQRTSNFYDSL